MCMSDAQLYRPTSLMLLMPQCLPIHSRPQIFLWSGLQSMNGLPVNTINICNLSLHCFNVVKCPKCSSNNSMAKISVKFLLITTVRVWVLFFHCRVHMPNLSIHTAARVHSHCDQGIWRLERPWQRNHLSVPWITIDCVIAEFRAASRAISAHSKII